MKFYLCHTPEGRKRLLTRQDEAKKLDKNCEPIDIPVDQAGIKAGYEELFDRIFDLEQQIGGSAPAEAPEEPQEQVLQQPAAEPSRDLPPVRFNSVWEATEIEDFILNRASIAQVGNIFSCLGTRFAEHTKESSLPS